MDVNVYFTYYSALFVIPIVGYILFFRKELSVCNLSKWYNMTKQIYSKRAIKYYIKENRQKHDKLVDKYKELPSQLFSDDDSDTIQFLSIDQKSNSIYFSMSVRRDKTARISLDIRLQDGTILQLPNKDNFIIASRAKNNWCAAGFNIEICDPFKRCRFHFNGFLRKITSDDSESIEHVRLNFIWNCTCKPLFYPEDVSENFLEAICKEPWEDRNWASLLGDCMGYEQYGAFIGQICFDDSSKNVELHIPTLRKRSIGLDKVLAWNRDVTFFLPTENGDLFHFGVTSLKYGCTHLKFGSVYHSNGVVESLCGTDMSLEHFSETGNIPEAFTIHVKTSSKVFKCVFHRRKSITSLRCREKSGFTQLLSKFEVCINTNIGTSIGLFWYRAKGEGLPKPKCLRRPLDNVEKLSSYVINLTDISCQILSLTGGKGSSLGILKSLQNGLYKVPDGFVVTTEAFKHQLGDNSALNMCVDDLETLNKNCSDKELKSACENLSKLFAKTPLNINISDVIKSELSKLLSSGVQFAVRSSGIIEDGDDFSCAGQNQTILGCKTEVDILEAVAKCWGSLYDFNSVKYRKQNGFPIRSEMAVVVQQLVHSEVSGVLFTCHPTDCNTSQMLITANYGLGESVVSGSADVDVIVLSRTFDGQLAILSKRLGDKASRVIADKVQGKSIEESVDAKLSKQFSLADDQALELGTVGLYLEAESGNSRDIEWAYVNGELYLLQSRAVTTINQWTDFELLHEFDRAVLTDLEVFTTANVGEVLPFANCPLAISTVHRQLEYAIQFFQQFGEPVLNEYAWTALAVFNNNIFIDIVNTFLGQAVDAYDVAAKINDLCIFGHFITKLEYIRTAREKHGPISGITKLHVLWVYIGFVRKNNYNLKRMHQHSQKVANSLKEISAISTSEEVYAKLGDLILDIRTVYKLHSYCSRVSILIQVATLLTLLQGNEEFTNDTFHDISLILTSNADNVVSAEVPRKMQEISGIILADDLGKEFCSIDTKIGVDWLRENCPKASQCLKYFLLEHGHRSFRELELYSKCWAEDPSVLIAMIQQNVKHNVTVKDDRSTFTVEETFAQLKTPIKSKIIATILKWLMSKCRQTVAIREETKNELVRNILATRHAFYHLASLLKCEGRIPDTELIFFFTIEELTDIISTYNPLLVTKAVKRRRLFPTWNAIRFSEICEGLPKPIQIESTETYFDNSVISMEGTPVCRGTVTARACVIKLIEQIEQLEAGDILITVCTDIAWSPYFPILSGVVTELGGLISHGAVVAREYGLPCLVGVKDASKSFKTGDIVCLDSTKGTISLVTRPA